MKKLNWGVTICLILTLIVITLLGACGEPTVAPSPDTTPAPTPAPTPDKEYIIRFASVFPSVSTLAQLFNEKAIELAKETNGQVKLESYWGGALYSSPADCALAVQEGSIEGTLGDLFLGMTPEHIMLMTTPLLFEDEAHYLRFMETEAWKKANQKLEDKGFLPIGGLLAVAGSYPCNSKRPISTLEDWDGLKMRMVPSPGFKAMADAFGFNMVSLPPAEVVTALETGMVDGVSVSSESWSVYRVQELCPYITKFSMNMAGGGMVVGKDWFNSLPADIQQIVQRVFDEISADHYRISQEKERDMWIKLAEYPQVVITELTAAEELRWFEAAVPIIEAAAASDPDIAAMLDAIDSVR